MFRLLFLLLLLFPLVDLYLLFRLSEFTGALWMVLLVVGTALVGLNFARIEGFRVLRRWQLDLARGQMPKEGVFSGLLILVGAGLLVLPGPVGDVLGLLLLLGPSRRLTSRILRRWVSRKIRKGSVRVYTHVHPPAQPGVPGSTRTWVYSEVEHASSSSKSQIFNGGEGRIIEGEGYTISEEEPAGSAFRSKETEDHGANQPENTADGDDEGQAREQKRLPGPGERSEPPKDD